MNRRGIILVLAAIITTAFLISVLREKRRVFILGKTANDFNTTYNLKKYSTEEGLKVGIQNGTNLCALFYISPESIDALSDSTLVSSQELDSLDVEQKCIRLWKFIDEWTDHDHPAQLVDHNYYSPAMMINGIEGGICDKRSAALANLADCAGIPGRVYKLKNHVVTELWYRNAWHMFDADKGIYYRRPDGEIADVAYLVRHPQLISAETKNLKGFMPKWRNEGTRRALSSSNYVDATYKVFQKDYSASLSLLPGEKLDFELTPINPVKKFIRAYIGKRDNPCFVRKGLRTTSLKINALDYGGGKQKIYACKMPYPITHVKITDKNIRAPVKVYYSPDSVHWYFKGTMPQADSDLDFDAFDKDNFGFTFKYYLKFEGHSISENEQIGVKTDFTFSEKMLISNPERAFVIHPLNDAGKNISVVVSCNK